MGGDFTRGGVTVRGVCIISLRLVSPPGQSIYPI